MSETSKAPQPASSEETNDDARGVGGAETPTTPVAATPVAPRFPKLDSLSNDNSRDGLSALPAAPVGFEGAISPYRLPVAALLAAIIALALFAADRGVEAIWVDEAVRTNVLIGLAVIGGLFVWAAARRRTVGVWAVGDELRLSKGLPSLKLRELNLADVAEIHVKRARFGSSGRVRLRTVSGQQISVTGIERAGDASAYLPLLLAAHGARGKMERDKDAERRARVAATIPYVVALPERASKAS